jgi:hypothetical protein
MAPDLQELLDGYPMIRECLLPYLDLAAHYTLRLTIRSEHLQRVDRKSMITECCKLGYLKLLKREHACKSIAAYHCTTVAAQYGQLHVLKWVAARCNRDELEEAMCNAAGAGHRHIITYLVGRGLTVGLWTSKFAIEGGQLSMLEWLAREFQVSSWSINCAVELALKNGHVLVARWLVERDSNYGYNEYTAAAALAKKDAENVKHLLGLMRWLEDEWGDAKLHVLMGATESDSTEFADWVWNQLSAEDKAEMIGHYRNFTAGSVSMINWILAHNLPLDKNQSWRYAAELGDIATLDYLRKMYRFANMSLHYHAAKHRHHHVTAWLLKHTPECKFDEALYNTLMNSGRYDLQYLVQHGCPRRLEQCNKIYTYLAKKSDMRAMEAMRKIGCPFDREKVFAAMSEKFKQKMEAQGW